MKNPFFKYILCVIAVLAGVALIDRAAGAGLDHLLAAVPVSQDIGKGRFAINDVKTDIVIVGSSRAAHHYIPTMIEDSLGCSVYNTGRDGCFFSDNICVANAILERYSPKILLLEVSNDCLYESASNTVEGMFPYYWKSPYIKSVIDSELGWQSPIQLSSKLYAYNASSFKLIGYGAKGLITGYQEDPLKGYAPIPYVERKVPFKLSTDTLKQTSPISETRKSQLQALLSRAHAQNTQMILICSPVFHKYIGNSNSRAEIIHLCQKTGAQYYDFSQEPSFLTHPEWFNDGTHLNCKGAETYTGMVIEKVFSNKHTTNKR